MSGLAGFVLLTFALTWTAWLLPAKLAAPGSAVFGVGGPVFLLGVFAPAIVAIALTARAEGRAGVAKLLSGTARWRVAGRYYVFAVFYMTAVKLLAASIHRITTGAWPGFGDEPWFLMLGALLVSTWVQAGEEVGWRGYALPRLAGRLGWGGAGIALGVLWALWHLPLFYIDGGGTEGHSFTLYLLYVTAISVAVTWLYWKTGRSLLLTMLMHAAVNNTTFIPLTSPERVAPMSFGGTSLAWTAVGVMWAIGAVLLFRMRGAAL